MLPVAMALSFTDALPVLWMTSCFTIEQIGRIKDNAYVSSSSPDGGSGSKVCRLRLHVSCLKSVTGLNNNNNNVFVVAVRKGIQPHPSASKGNLLILVHHETWLLNHYVCVFFV